jgi:hypothetical protein
LSQFYYGTKHLSCLRKETIHGLGFDLPEEEEPTPPTPPTPLTPPTPPPTTVGRKFKFKKVSKVSAADPTEEEENDILMERTQIINVSPNVSEAKIDDETSEYK